MAKIIKLFDPLIGHNEERVLVSALKSHFWASGAGTRNVLKFENEFKKYVGADECVALNSGTAALHLALSLADIKGKEVILPSLSFVSTAHAVIYNGGKPIFADINPETLCMEPADIERKITEKTKVILPVHFAGMSADLNKINEICDKKNTLLIEDASHAAGTKYKNKKIGSHGIAVCFSFHPVKNLAMPTGGAVTLNGKYSHKAKTILQSLRWCGISNRKETTYDVTRLGWNYYMNEFSAVIGLEQLKKLNYMNSIRRQTAKRYSNEIKIDKKMFFTEESTYHFYWIQVKNRIDFMKKLKENGIETGIHYKPIHTMGFYRDKIKLPNTETVGKHIVSIPTHPNLTEPDISKIIKLVNRFA